MGVPFPQLLVMGGLDHGMNVLEDAWILDLDPQSPVWTEVEEHKPLVYNASSESDDHKCQMLSLGVGCYLTGVIIQVWMCVKC